MARSAAQEFAYLFRLPPQQAIDYLQGRDQLTRTYSWQDLWHDEHTQQFTVSRLARMDILKAMQDSITASVDGDLTRSDWIRDTKALLKNEGWWGEKTLIDEFTGEAVTTKFDSARLKLIFDTNTRQAYAAGLWQHIADNKAARPYIRYITRRDGRVRAQHQRWDNLVLPVDDPFWKTRFPPNGYRCRCHATGVSQAEYDKGYSEYRANYEYNPDGTIKRIPDVEQIPFNKVAPPDDLQTFVNQRTGNVSEVPAGVMPGFDFNPGMARAERLRQVAAAKLDSLPGPLAGAAVTDLARGEEFVQWFAKPDGAYPLVVIPAADAALIGSKEHTGMLSADTAIKQHGMHPEMTVAEYALAQTVIDGATNKVQDTPNSMIYIREEVSEEAGGYVLVVKATKTGAGLWVTSYRRLSRQDAMRDAEISRLLAKENK